MRRLRAVREAMGIRQSELARRAGMNPAVICNIEFGRLYPYPGWKRRIGEALGLPSDRWEELFLDDPNGPYEGR